MAAQLFRRKDDDAPSHQLLPSFRLDGQNEIGFDNERRYTRLDWL